MQNINGNSSKIEIGFDDKRLGVEFDEFQDIKKIQILWKRLTAKFSRSISQKYLDKKNFYTTGVAQLGATFPHPYDREDLLKREFAPAAWFQHSWVGVLATVLAMFIDGLSIYLLFSSGQELSSDFLLYFTIGAVIGIDVVPMFLAHILYHLNAKRKTVYFIVLILSGLLLLFIIVVLGLLAKYRHGSTPYNWIPDKTSNNGFDSNLFQALFQILIPLSTTLLSFIINYISYAPDKKIYNNLLKCELFHFDNINELNAMLAEIETDPNYPEDLLENDNLEFQTMCNFISQLAEYYKRDVRVTLATIFESPAATSDLTCK